MAETLGRHNPRIERVRALRTKKGRREQGRFVFEGATLVDEALRSGIEIEELYATPGLLEPGGTPAILRARGVRVYAVDARTMSRLSTLETPPGIIAVAPVRFGTLAELLRDPGLVLALADLSDPGNAGTLLRTAEAFGVSRVIFGRQAVEPYSPKVVRAAMGSLFRLRLAVAAPAEIAAAADGWQVTGLAASGEAIEGLSWQPKGILVVGQERRGLGDWAGICGRRASITMTGPAESLNAAVAGGIALYEAAGGMLAGSVKRV